VCQSIAGIGYLISAVQQGLTETAKTEAVELERVAQLAARTVQQVREIARGLFPGEIRNGRLSGALQELANHTRDVYGSDCQFEGRTDLRVADPNTAIQMYRIAQEAVNNAVKHSKAKTIRIGLSQRCGRIILTVRDTGVGYFRKPDTSTGMGQRIMKHRADTIGATLTVTGVRGKGTMVTCELPCERVPRRRTSIP
jgi:signal transduction histidine kinase